ncbi:hypothetical protein ILUMI_09070 [Ignelater luminosus]|uniref:Uncharacterized protein n=1 Tax=Ignelater luminosus TaxID=2038154 RepID=A0A8K0GFE4_IGNLU|nr:hypothetical protein ILUMI_09070 [Ignelater luminosus]
MYFLTGIFKTLVVRQRRLQIGKLFKTLEQEPFLPNPERGGEGEEKLTKAYWSAAVSAVALAIGVTVTKRFRSDDYHDWEFPYGPVETFNATYSPNYEIIVAYQITNMAFLATYFSTTDLIAAAVLVHVTYQFRILQHNIKNIVKLGYKEMSKNSLTMDKIDSSHIDASLIPWKYLKKSLTDVIQYHLAIISVVDELENVFSGLFLVAFISSLGMIALMLYHILLLPLNDTRTFPAVVELLCANLQTLVICYWGEQVLNESQLVGDSVFETNFFGADTRGNREDPNILDLSNNQRPQTELQSNEEGLGTNFLLIVGRVQKV